MRRRLFLAFLMGGVIAQAPVNAQACCTPREVALPTVHETCCMEVSCAMEDVRCAVALDTQWAAIVTQTRHSHSTHLTQDSVFAGRDALERFAKVHRGPVVFQDPPQYWFLPISFPLRL